MSRRPTRRDVTNEEADRIVNEVERAIEEGRGTVSFPRRGRPSLSGEAAESPIVGFRLTPELRSRAQDLAQRRGISVSTLARQALEDYVRRAG